MSFLHNHTRWEILAGELLAENAALRSSLQAVCDYLRDKPATDMPPDVAEIIQKYQNEGK